MVYNTIMWLSVDISVYLRITPPLYKQIMNDKIVKHVFKGEVIILYINIIYMYSICIYTVY